MALEIIIGSSSKDQLRAIYAIYLAGSVSSNYSQEVVIKETASVVSFNDWAINVLSYASTVDNRGSIWTSSVGIYMAGQSTSTTSKVINSGLIEAGSDGIWHGSNSTEKLEIVNTGKIVGGAYSIYSSSSTSVEQIKNTGTLVGDVSLGGGDDVYNGAKGSLKGAIYAGAGDDKLTGGKDNDTFFGEAGKDTLNGGAGNDKLTGGLGADTLIGGAGADTFIFTTIADSTVAASGRDTIMDFSRSQKDKIDLKAIDANTTKAGDQAFKFIGADKFSKKAGELRYEEKSGKTYVYGDVNGDGKADFSIMLNNKVALVAGDFTL